MDILMKVLFVIIILGIIFIIKSRFDKKLYRKRILEYLTMQWGMYTREDYSDKDWKNITYYHKKKERERKI